MTRTAAALQRDRELANARQRAYEARKRRARAPRAAAPRPSPGRDDACPHCGRAHQAVVLCPDTPRAYHDAPFLKKYGA